MGLALAVAGCGFTPAYGPTGAAGKLQNAVSLTAPETVAGFTLLARLADRLGSPTIPRYALVVTLEATQVTAAVNTDGDTTRLQLVGAAPWTLTDMAGQTLASGTARTFTSYSATGTTVATQAAQADAETRLAQSLADLILADLTARAAELP